MRSIAAGVLVVTAAALLAGCKGDAKPPDPLKTQRQAIDQSKGVEQVLEQSATSRRNDAEPPK
jgi:hypothetical protein